MLAKDVLTEEWLSDVLQDSLEMDWTSTDGARAIMRALKDGLVELPQRGGQVASRFNEDGERVSYFKAGWKACEAWWQGGHTGDPDTEFNNALLEHTMLAAAPKVASDTVRSETLIAKHNVQVDAGTLDPDPRHDSNHPLHDIVCGWCGKVHHSKVASDTGADQRPGEWDHRYRPLKHGETIAATDECRRDDGTWITGICVGEPAPDPAYTSHRVYRRLIVASETGAGLRSMLQEAHDTLHECTAVLHADDCRKVAAVMERIRHALATHTDATDGATGGGEDHVRHAPNMIATTPGGDLLEQAERDHNGGYTVAEVEAMDDEPRYLIRKGGAYYRKNSQGYTHHRQAAGRYRLDEAISITHPNGPNGPRDGMDYVLDTAGDGGEA